MSIEGCRSLILFEMDGRQMDGIRIVCLVIVNLEDFEFELFISVTGLWFTKTCIGQ
jgi:hypothetical protein